MEATSRFAALLSALLTLAACGAGDGRPPASDVGAAVAVVDDRGREVRLAAPPERVISLIPSTTDLLLAIGMADRLVARTDYDVDPRLADRPSVGGGLDPSLEGLVALDPDLVVAWPDERSRTVVGRLRALGIPVYSARIHTIDDVERTARRLGTLLDADAAADSLVRHIRTGLDSVRRSTAERPRPTVFYVVWGDPPRTVGPGTFIHELIEVAGGRNAFANLDAQWPQVSLEAVVRRQPDVVVLSNGDRSPGLERLRRTPGWRDLEAVRHGRVLRVEPDLFNRAGPRLVEAARSLAERLEAVSSALEPAS